MPVQRVESSGELLTSEKVLAELDKQVRIRLQEQPGIPLGKLSVLAGFRDSTPETIESDIAQFVDLQRGVSEHEARKQAAEVAARSGGLIQ